MEELPPELIAPLRHWRQAHPHATWDAIEEEVDRLLKGRHADLVSALAMPLSDALQEPPTCPSCQQDLRPCGQRERQVQSRRGPLIRLHRPYSVCPACGTGLFPPG